MGLNFGKIFSTPNKNTQNFLQERMYGIEAKLNTAVTDESKINKKMAEAEALKALKKKKKIFY